MFRRLINKIKIIKFKTSFTINRHFTSLVYHVFEEFLSLKSFGDSNNNNLEIVRQRFMTKGQKNIKLQLQQETKQFRKYTNMIIL